MMIKKILVLLVLMVVNVWATSEELGVPYIEKGKGQIDSAVLAPDGESFYTLKDGLITQWQLSPIKKIMSFQTDIKKSKNILSYRLHILSNQNKLIVCSKEKVMFYDLKSKKLLSTSFEKQFFSVLSDDLITVSQKGKVLLWDTETMKIKSEFNKDDRGDYYYAIVEGAHLVLISPFYINIFDRKTLDFIDEIPMYGTTYIPFDKKSIYFEDLNKKDKYYKYDFQLNEIEIVKHDVFQNKTDRHKAYVPLRYKNQVHSRTAKYSLVRIQTKITYKFTKSARYTLIKDKEIMGQLFYFKDGEWLFMKPNFHFSASSQNVRKHLKLKTLNNKLIPMSMKQYKKYNKTEKLYPWG